MISAIWFGVKILMSINRDQRNVRQIVEKIEFAKVASPVKKNDAAKKND